MYEAGENCVVRQKKGYDTELLFRYMVSAFTGLAVNLSAIYIDLLLVNKCFYGRFDTYAYIHSLSGSTYVFICLVSFMVLGCGIFLLRKESGGKCARRIRMALGIVLALIQVGECAILLMHSVILGCIFLVSLAASLLLGFCVHSVKAGVHMVYYAAALFLNVGCTMFIGVCCIKGRMICLYFLDSVAVIVPLTALLPLISFDRARCRQALSGRNTHSSV